VFVNTFSEVFEYFSEKLGILFGLGIEKEPIGKEKPPLWVYPYTAAYI